MSTRPRRLAACKNAFVQGMKRKQPSPEPAVVPTEDDVLGKTVIESCTVPDVSEPELTRLLTSKIPGKDAEVTDMECEVPSEDESPEREEKHAASDPDYDDKDSDVIISDEDVSDDPSTIGEGSFVGSGDDDWPEGGGSKATRTVPNYTPRAPRNPGAYSGNTIGVELIPWLKKNFRLSRNPSAIMPRSHLYTKYEKFCALRGLPVVNSACLGKVLRRSFPGVDTRRLGRRGESKYHYVGLEVNPGGDASQSGGEDDAEEVKKSKPVIPERNRPKRAPVPLPKPREPVLRLLNALDYEDRITIIVDQLRETFMNMGAGHTSFLPDLLLHEERWIQVVPLMDAQEEQTAGFRTEDVANFILSFRIHVGMVSYAIASGALLLLPEIFRNFWVTRDERWRSLRDFLYRPSLKGHPSRSGLTVTPKLQLTTSTIFSTLALEAPFLQLDWLTSSMDVRSLQISATLRNTNPASYWKLYAWRPLQKFVSECYLGAYQKLLDHFTTHLNTSVGSILLNLLEEFSFKYPTWIHQAVCQTVCQLECSIFRVVHTSAAAFSIQLRKSVGLAVAFSRVNFMRSDMTKAMYVEEIFRQIEPAWLRISVPALTSAEQREIQKQIQETRVLLAQTDNLALWQKWVDDLFLRKLSECEYNLGDAEACLRKAAYLRQISLLWSTACKTLVALARTDVDPKGPFRCIDPFSWLLEFFERFIRIKAEAAMAELQKQPEIIVSYEALWKSSGPYYAEKLEPVSLTFFTDFFIDELFSIDVNNRTFFAASQDLQPLLKAPEVAQAVPELSAITNLGGEESMLEQLLR